VFRALRSFEIECEYVYAVVIVFIAL